jgi:hypothetical protein
MKNITQTDVDTAIARRDETAAAAFNVCSVAIGKLRKLRDAESSAEAHEAYKAAREALSELFYAGLEARNTRDVAHTLRDLHEEQKAETGR